VAITTYAELQTAIGDWLARDDLTARAPDFITFAEARLNRELRCRQMVAQATGTASSSVIAIVADMIEPILVRVDDVVIDYRPPTDFYSRDAVNQTSSIARYYTVVGAEFRVAPTPTAATAYTIDYYQEIAALSTTATSNWLLAKWPNIYLYAALLEAEPFLKNDDRVPLWQQFYTAAKTAINGADQRIKAVSGPQAARILV
jgi:hypothetical protein